MNRSFDNELDRSRARPLERWLAAAAGPALVAALAAPAVLHPAAAPAGLEAALAEVEVSCEQMKHWGRYDDGTPWIRFDMSCNLPEAARQLVEGQDPGPLLSALDDRDAKYAAASAMTALGRLRELPAPERVRLALEVARRESEPFASASLGFVFGETSWWDLPDAGGVARRPLGHLAAPWERSMTPVVREYLLPEDGRGPVGTLAAYVCTLMVEELDPVILPDLEKASQADEPGPLDLGARLAGEALKGLEERLARERSANR